MAVKASALITLSAVTDVSSVTRYYLLQSSTLSKPSKPASKPPGGSWSDSEPTYTAGSTNSLYFVDLTVFSDGTWSYSSVSLSSSYEAAKAAYNKASTAQSTAQQAQAYAADANTRIEGLEDTVFDSQEAANEALSRIMETNSELGKWFVFDSDEGLIIRCIDDEGTVVSAWRTVTSETGYRIENTSYGALFEAYKDRVRMTNLEFKKNDLSIVMKPDGRGGIVWVKG